MQILVLGATGYAGKPVADEFVRSGFIVYGQTRSADKAKSLAADEIIPVISDPAKDLIWLDIVKKVDVVVDCIGGNKIADLSKMIFEQVEQAAASVRPAGQPKLIFVYTSGTWNHGDDKVTYKSERSVLANTTELIAWRAGREQAVIGSKVVDGIVIRAALLYGRSGSIIGDIFKAASKGEAFSYPGRVGGRYALCHTDDLATLYVKVVESAPITKGVCFDAVNNQSESQADVLEAVARYFKCPSWSFSEPSSPWEEAVQVTSRLRPTLGRSLVGWVPKKMGLVDGLEIYIEAWRNSA